MFIFPKYKHFEFICAITFQKLCLETLQKAEFRGKLCFLLLGSSAFVQKENFIAKYGISRIHCTCPSYREPVQSVNRKGKVKERSSFTPITGWILSVPV